AGYLAPGVRLEAGPLRQDREIDQVQAGPGLLWRRGHRRHPGGDRPIEACRPPDWTAAGPGSYKSVMNRRAMILGLALLLLGLALAGPATARAPVRRPPPLLPGTTSVLWVAAH